MTFEDFLAMTEEGKQPPEDLGPELRALWLTKRDRWDDAHDVVNDLPSSMGSWIHAHLHRIEGDLGNAGYWYARAGKPAIRSRDGLEEEWKELVKANL